MTTIKPDLLAITENLIAVSGAIDNIKDACPQKEFATIIQMINVLQKHIILDAAKLKEITDRLEEGAFQ